MPTQNEILTGIIPAYFSLDNFFEQETFENHHSLNLETLIVLFGLKSLDTFFDINPVIVFGKSARKCVQIVIHLRKLPSFYFFKRLKEIRWHFIQLLMLLN